MKFKNTPEKLAKKCQILNKIEKFAMMKMSKIHMICEAVAVRNHCDIIYFLINAFLSITNNSFNFYL